MNQSLRFIQDVDLGVKFHNSLHDRKGASDSEKNHFCSHNGNGSRENDEVLFSNFMENNQTLKAFSMVFRGL